MWSLPLFKCVFIFGQYQVCIILLSIILLMLSMAVSIEGSGNNGVRSVIKIRLKPLAIPSIQLCYVMRHCRFETKDFRSHRVGYMIDDSYRN